jgi:RecG-like helicase
MTDLDFKKMIEAALKVSPIYGWQYGVYESELRHLVEQAMQAEREAAEERVTDLFADMETPYLPDIIAAIRARGE